MLSIYKISLYSIITNVISNIALKISLAMISHLLEWQPYICLEGPLAKEIQKFAVSTLDTSIFAFYINTFVSLSTKIYTGVTLSRKW